MAARLFLVASLDVGAAPDRLAVGNLRRVKLDLDVVTLLELADDDFEMLLAVAGEEKLFRLRVAVEVQ